MKKLLGFYYWYHYDKQQNSDDLTKDEKDNSGSDSSNSEVDNKNNNKNTQIESNDKVIKQPPKSPNPAPNKNPEPISKPISQPIPQPIPKPIPQSIPKPIPDVKPPPGPEAFVKRLETLMSNEKDCKLIMSLVSICGTRTKKAVNKDPFKILEIAQDYFEASSIINILGPDEKTLIKQVCEYYLQFQNQGYILSQVVDAVTKEGVDFDRVKWRLDEELMKNITKSKKVSKGTNHKNTSRQYNSSHSAMYPSFAPKLDPNAIQSAYGLPPVNTVEVKKEQKPEIKKESNNISNEEEKRPIPQTNTKNNREFKRDLKKDVQTLKPKMGWRKTESLFKIKEKEKDSNEESNSDD